MKPFLVYILQCADASYYCGHTDDLERRLRQHGEGLHGYTVTRRPLKLLWTGEFETRESAVAFERKIKGWSRAKKAALIAGDWNRISELAKPRARDFPPNLPFDELRANGVVTETDSENCR
ncbi:GIY-YIG nuclease family protein [Aromatoleum evansii]|uniref:GIY-YIG nuclease family protein n=1 Tax=Aromatoleum evansii TaxID=59406 RepID=UPI00145F17CE|nr:GIY-YIG nuclease family protein [Aromatoleum evansii]NMG28592.1 GIY-YIG nuclease family protein [Aromatoleum evansii]